jgi:uncharacterized RDD family membrane protein YckC
MDVAGGPAEVQALVAAPEAGVVTAPESGLRYVGLATRAISFALDAAVLNLVAIIVSVGAALILSILHLPSDLKTVLGVIGAVVYVLWLVGYFVVFWSTTGQTPGARVMQIQVLTAEGKIPGPKRALVRWVGVILAALPLFAGFVRILFDPRRRGFQDRLAGTVVVEATQASLIAARLARSSRSGDDHAIAAAQASDRA